MRLPNSGRRGLTAKQRKVIRDGMATGMTEEECYRAMGQGLAYRKKMLNGTRDKNVDDLTDEEKAVIFLDEQRRRSRASEISVFVLRSTSCASMTTPPMPPLFV